MIPLRNKKALVVVVVILALFVFLLPALVAYRYTAHDERNQFLTHPWRGWSFALAALAVPGDSQLKTSGMALRKAAWLFKGTSVDPREVQLEFVRKRQPYTFTHTVDGLYGDDHRQALVPVHLAGAGRGGHPARQDADDRRPSRLSHRPPPLRHPQRPAAVPDPPGADRDSFRLAVTRRSA